MLPTNHKFICKKINCGCIVNAVIHPGFLNAVIQPISKNECGFCTQEQKEENITHLWLTETEKYVWEDLLKCYGWSRESDTKKNDNIKISDISTHIEIMERENLWNFHSVSTMDENKNVNDID